MPSSHKLPSLIDLGLEALGRIQPSCSRALILTRRGINQRLGVVESLALKYHAQLCPRCGCKREALNELMQQKFEAETDRGVRRKHA
jgi:hypothetical protein